MTDYPFEMTQDDQMAQVHRVEVGRVDVRGDVGRGATITIGDETANLNAGQALVLAKALAAVFPWEINVTGSLGR